jgi:hypothetical protein
MTWTEVVPLLVLLLLQARHIVVAVDDSDEGYWSVGWVVQHLWRQGKHYLARVLTT